MERELGPNHQDLLTQLGELIQTPSFHSLHQHFNPQEKVQEKIPHPIKTPLSSPTLLQRMTNFESSANLKRRSSYSETTEPPKRAGLLLSSGSSRRTLMSRLLNPKRTPHSTPILQKFSLLNLQKTTLEKSDPQTMMPLLNWLTSPPPKGSRMPNMPRTPPNLIPIQTMTNPLRNRNSTSSIYHGMNPQIVRQPAILSCPVGLDFHTEAGFDFSDFFPLLNPSRIFWDVIIWFYSIYCMFI